MVAYSRSKSLSDNLAGWERNGGGRDQETGPTEAVILDARAQPREGSFGGHPSEQLSDCAREVARSE